MLFKFPKEKIGEEEFNSIKDTWSTVVLNWIIDYRYRESIRLTKWLLEQDFTTLSEALKNIPDTEDYDKQVVYCLKWVMENISYVSDITQWDVTEKWQTIQETMSSRKGDCEDGAILLYWLCRFKGVPPNRLYLFTGDTNGGGHCWLGYKPQEYPLNWVFLDWCYKRDATEIGSRNFYYINDKKITAYKPNGQSISFDYSKIWFLLNENDCYIGVR